MATRSLIPQVVARYGFERHPIIAEAFKPGVGWKRYPPRKRITVSWARKMKREGYTSVGLTDPATPNKRTVDFTLDEIIRSPSVNPTTGRIHLLD